jgi:hypothetical protein
VPKGMGAESENDAEKGREKNTTAPKCPGLSE